MYYGDLGPFSISFFRFCSVDSSDLSYDCSMVTLTNNIGWLPRV